MSGRNWKNLKMGSPQVIELRAVATAFQCFPDTLLNIAIESVYVVDTAQRLDLALLKEVENAQLFSILKGLWHPGQRSSLLYFTC